MNSFSEDRPKVSIIIPTYNGGDWLLDTIQSCLIQNVSKEVIVVDDASTDGTPQRVASHFPSVVLIQLSENSGSGSFGRNTGLETANGQYETFARRVRLLGFETVKVIF